MTNEQIRQLTDTIYRALFDADGAALRIRLGLPPADPDDITDDDLRDEMGDLALEALDRVETFMTKWMTEHRDFVYRRVRIQTRMIAKLEAMRSKAAADVQGVDLLTGQKKDEKC